MRMMRIPPAWLEWFDFRRAIVWTVAIGGGYAWLVHRALVSGRSPMGVLAMAPRVLRFLLWAERDVRRPWSKKRTGALDDA